AAVGGAEAGASASVLGRRAAPGLPPPPPAHLRQHGRFWMQHFSIAAQQGGRPAPVPSGPEDGRKAGHPRTAVVSAATKVKMTTSFVAMACSFPNHWPKGSARMWLGES